MTTNKTHHENQFQPGDYEIIDYFDNQPPKFEFGMKQKHWDAMFEAWKKERDYLFPAGNAYRCQHCGQGRVRYVVAVKHIPTGEHVCFGDICVGRLGFRNHDEFKAAMVRKRANTAAISLRISEKIHHILMEDTELKEACDALIEDPEDGVHARNGFAYNVLDKFKKYGSLSVNQRNALVDSVNRDKERAARRQAEADLMAANGVEAPEGRCEIEGEVLSTKVVDSAFGTQCKMLVKLDSGAKIWSTIPSAICMETERGVRVQFTATFERAVNDKGFAYATRPSKAKIVSAAA